MSEKLLLFGLDGGSLEIIENLIEEGELPTFKKLMENGVYGKLESTIPPITIPAWPAMFTGLNPGNLGIVDHLALDRNYEENVGFPNLKRRYLWDFLNENGYKTGIVNAPGVRRVYRLNGFIALGLSEKSKVYPGDLDLDRTETPVHEGKRIPKRIEILLENLNKRKKTLSQLLEKEWDLLIFVAEEPDNITHFVEDWPKVREVYRKIDEHLKMILEETENCNIMIASDHGIKKIRRRVFINALLREMDLLHENKNMSKSLLSKSESFLREKFGKSFVQGLIGSVPFLGGWQAKSMMSLDRMDKEETKIFGYGARAGSYARLWVNSEERFEKGIVKEGGVNDLLDEFKDEIKDRDEGFIEEIYEGPEVYEGKRARWIPDLIARLAEDCVEDYKLESEKVNEEEGFAHALQGVFMAYGPEIRSTGKELENPRIYDIAPTILHAFGTAVPEKMNGRVMKEIFEEGTKPSERSVNRQKTGEKEKIKEKVSKLKSLDEI